jgi:K+-sensing histidine kinase KdpD
MPPGTSSYAHSNAPASEAALSVRFALGDALTRVPFLTFFPAVLFAAFGGLWPGILATALSALFSAYYLIEPVDTFSIGATFDWIGLAFFLIVCGTITVRVHPLSRASSQSVLAT